MTSPSPPFIYLASQSPRRSQLLDQLGVRHELLVADADEDAESIEIENAGEWPLPYVQRVTRAKLVAARERLERRGWPPAPILCSDTTVALGRRIFGKPHDASDAAAALRRLSGRTHQVLSAVIVANGMDESMAVSRSHVTFAPLADEEIAAYVASGEPFGKAGSYAIQGAAGAWVSRIDGSYTGIMGLPLFETAQLLRALGIPSFACKTS